MVSKKKKVHSKEKERKPKGKKVNNFTGNIFALHFVDCSPGYECQKSNNIIKSLK